ncbi:hypothetical protein WJX75_000907 [Coccomyxa subellipsoidea]|uniref:Uncharacterized protein n=1 Tax=Coccomyxa subellipsoidea TaxID=248742 RepID=A0ABR2YH66_9CHLO
MQTPARFCVLAVVLCSSHALALDLQRSGRLLQQVSGVGGSQSTGLGSTGTDNTNSFPSNTDSTATASAKAEAQSGFSGGDAQAAAQAIATSGSGQDVADAFSQAYSQGMALL